MTPTLAARLRPLAADLDRVLATGLARLIERSGWSDYELDQSLQDLLALSAHRDACYDRPSTGWAYGVWYHGRRTHDAVRLLAPVLAGRTGTVAIADLGTGTGATLWALAALVVAAGRASVALPRLRVVATDTSEPMITAAERLWAALRGSGLGAAAQAVDVRFELVTWTDVASLALPDADTRWLVGGYLFDDSDHRRGHSLGEHLHDGAVAVGAEEVHLVGNGGKAAIVNRLARVLDGRGWQRLDHPPTAALWHGALPAVAAHRSAAYGGVARTRHLPDTPTWVRSGDAPTFLRFRDSGARDELFHPSRHATVTLDEEQERAARPDAKLTAIVGAAGSGKSRVLVERVIRTVEQRPRREGPARVLVTTFNRAMVDQLAEWLAASLPRTTLRRWHWVRHLDTHCFSDPDEPEGSSIVVLNWDKVPSRLFGVPTNVVRLSPDAIDRVLRRAGHDPGALSEHHRRVLTPDFVEAELQRVIYGLRSWHDRSAYLAVDRRGRRSAIGTQQRELVWAVAFGRGIRTWSHYRIEGLERARAAAAAGRRPSFTHVFLDECQDMTPADFELASLLVDDPDHLVVAGDEAQSLHLGASYQRPGHVEIPEHARVAGGPAYRRWRVRRLHGSYRLPIRVCECVQPLARHLAQDRRLLDGEHDVGLPEAKKPAVLGIRPIVVSAANAVEAVPRVLAAYRRTLEAISPSAREITVAEHSFPVEPVQAAAPPGYRVTAASMLQIKGLERACVVWSTGAPIRSHESEIEWAYTILTRTSCLAVIVVDPVATPDERAAVLRLLRRDRLLCWDAAADDALRRATA